MSSAHDPVVARALDQLVPRVESDPDETLRRARSAAQALKRRRVVRLGRAAVLAFAALALLTGAALAASRFDVLPFFDQSNRSTASYSVDNSRTYSGPAPRVLLCPDARPGSFDCSVGTLKAGSHRAYLMEMRVEATPQLTRAELLRALAAAEKKGKVDHAAAERFRRDLAAISDDFLTVWNLAASGGTLFGGSQVSGEPDYGRVPPPGFELVPPAGVPMAAACQAAGDAFRCHDLASSRDVPVGTPLYRLQSSSDWVPIPREPQRRPPGFDLLFRAVVGRDMTPAELRFAQDFVDSVTLTVESGPVEGKRVPPKNASP
jgi:hypothetical protein